MTSLSPTLPKHHNKFRKILIPEDILRSHGEVVFEKLRPLLDLWQQGKIRDYEMAGLYILLFLQQIYPLRWCLGYLPEGKLEDKGGPPGIPYNLFHLPQDLLGLPPKIHQRFPLGPTVYQLFFSQAFKSIPLCIHRTLAAWAQGQWSLELVTHVPSPREILKKQAQGTRVVTMVVEKEQLRQFVIGERDPLGFILHDLIHADRFFRHPRLFGPQKGFFQAMEMAMAEGIFTSFLQEDPEFREELDYVLSDMNAYCVHQLKYLKAIVFHIFLRKNGLGAKDLLLPQEKNAYNLFFQELFRFWKMPPAVWEGAMLLNTDQAEPDRHFSLMEDFFLNFSSHFNCPSHK